MTFYIGTVSKQECNGIRNVWRFLRGHELPLAAIDDFEKKSTLSPTPNADDELAIPSVR